MTDRASYPLRMPVELREYFEQQAQQNGRSLQKELIYRLEMLRGLDNILASQQHASGDLNSLLIELLATQRKLGNIHDQIEQLKAENRTLQHRNTLLAKQIGEDDDNRRRKIERLRKSLEGAADEFEHLFPKDTQA